MWGGECRCVRCAVQGASDSSGRGWRNCDRMRTRKGRRLSNWEKGNQAVWRGLDMFLALTRSETSWNIATGSFGEKEKKDKTVQTSFLPSTPHTSLIILLKLTQNVSFLDKENGNWTIQQHQETLREDLQQTTHHQKQACNDPSLVVLSKYC